MGYIYKITNNVNNKCYIGKTKGTVLDRFNRHIKDSECPGTNYLHRAIKKYGINCFSVSVVEECDLKCINEREKYWIKYYNSNCNEFGYNLTLGGDGGDTFSLHSEHEKKIIRKNMSKAQKLISQSTAKKLSEIFTEKYKHEPHPSAGKPAWNKGLTQETDARVKKIAEAQRGVPKGTGKALTMEKEKLRRLHISNTMKGKRNGIGNKSLCGKRWIHNATENKVVDEINISFWLDNGWELGMCSKQYQPYNSYMVQDLTHNVTYKSIQSASVNTGISPYYIKKSFKENKPYKGVQFIKL